ncbi:rubrerythrin family protein [Candidatus Omnitrophota bacterium]
MATIDNLKEAFAGESQANRKYLAFAKQAEVDGKPQIAKLFRAAAGAETVHAHAHLRAMNGVGKTPDNVKAAVEGEGHEFNVMYPEFIETAKKEGNQAALRSFQFAIAVEKIHHDLYSKAAEALSGGNDMAAAKIFVCPVCGNTVLDQAPDKCPICGVPGSKFDEIK